MNECGFFLHLFLVLGCSWTALKLGKEAIMGWVALQAILANLFVLKQTCLFGLHVTCSDVYAIGCILGLNLIQEFFGKDSAKKATWISFSFMLFFALMAQMHLFYTPSLTDTAHPAYSLILSASPRLLLASLTTFFIVQRVDVLLYARVRKNSISLICSQVIDTALFSFLGLFGLVPELLSVFFFSLVVKIAIVLLMLPALHFFRRSARV